MARRSRRTAGPAAALTAALAALLLATGARTCSPIPVVPPPCTPDCAGRECGDDGCGSACGACAAPDTCDAALAACVCDCAPEAEPLCGRDGVSYAGPCELRCAAGAPDCVAADDCPGAFYAGPCETTCHVADATPVPVGALVPAFLCFDVNTRSATNAAPYSDLTLREQVWIAYFGTCT